MTDTISCARYMITTPRKKPWQRFCSRQCRSVAWMLEHRHAARLRFRATQRGATAPEHGEPIPPYHVDASDSRIAGYIKVGGRLYPISELDARL